MSSSTDRNLYLDLLKKCLTNSIYGDSETGASFVSNRFTANLVANLLTKVGLRLVHIKKYDSRLRAVGKDWPITAHTMIGLKRLDNIQRLVEEVLKNDIAGDLIETGVWRGGATIFMRAILKSYNIKNRYVWVADSFSGLPSPDLKNYPQDASSDLHTVRYLSVGLKEVKKNFASYDLLDNQVKFLAGYFKDTLKSTPIKKLAVIRFDGDTHEAVTLVLKYLYPKLSKGGFMIIDDYKVIRACKNGVDDFRRLNHITGEIKSIDSSSIFWQKT